jgi:hypothetical protein
MNKAHRVVLETRLERLEQVPGRIGTGMKLE